MGKKNQKIFFLPSAGPGTRQRRDLYRVQGLGTRQRPSLLSARAGTRQRFKKKLMAWAGSAVKCHFFAECHSLPSVALGKEGFCRVPPFAECRALCGTRQSHSLPSARLCRVPPGPALGKEWLRRVPDFWHSAKLAALGKSAFSRSDSWRRKTKQDKIELAAS